MSLRCREWGGLLLLCALLSTGCERETRRFREVPPPAAPHAGLSGGPLRPGPTVRPVSNDYEENAWAVSEGKRLFRQFNCTGCHAQGGGSIGPALMDAEWIYGSASEHIYASIAEGRPNGMPAFGGKLGTAQIWQLAAYVRSLSGWIRKDVAPAREDAMQVKSQEQATDEQEPSPSAPPPAAERP